MLGDKMQETTFRLIPTVLLGFLAISIALQAQSDPAKSFKTNCAQCHSADGSGDSAAGKALHAKDLRSDEVQKQSDAALNEVITKGKGKMPAFGARIQPNEVQKLVVYIRNLPAKK
jgi:mono/diheme cytochrome c family protein